MSTNIKGGIADFQLPPAIIISDRAGLIIEYRDYKIDDRRDNPYIQSDSITGSNGGAVSEVGLVYVWDNRDQVFFPNLSENLPVLNLVQGFSISCLRLRFRNPERSSGE